MSNVKQLPIDKVLPEIVTTLRENGSVVIEAPTGAGKSTRVPPAIHDNNGRVIVVQPRRVAARAVARRIAEEMGVQVGAEVGYQVRFENNVSEKTQIAVVTDGILLRMLQSDPFLEGVAAVCFDEFHERRLNTDLALALCRRVQREIRDDLRLVVMSATLDTGPIAGWLEAPSVRSEGRTFPVDIAYEPGSKDTSLAGSVLRALRKHGAEVSGDVLVFLPGVAEIRAVHDALETSGPGNEFDVLDLYGALPPERQDAVFQKSSRRRIILSTNVAETSVTIPGIELVIDSGLAKVMRLDPSSGFDRLETENISLAEADQRAGRAGRVQAGRAVRLWDPHSERHRSAFPTSEIQRVDLAPAALELFAWGERELADFPWFEKPDRARREQAEDLLHMLGLVRDGAITSLGRAARQLPVNPRIAVFLLSALEPVGTKDACLVAALLSERDIFLRSFGDEVGNTGSESDIDDRIRAITENRWRRHVHRGALASVRALARKLQRDVRKVSRDERQEHAGDCRSLEAAFARAFPDRIAMFRGGDEQRALTADGRGLFLHHSSSVSRSRFFVALHVVDTQAHFTESLCVMAAGIEREDIPTHMLEEHSVYEFVSEAGRVEVRDELRCGAIVLESRNSQTRDQQKVSELLIEAASEDLERAIGLDDRDTREFLARWAFAAKHCEDTGFFELDEKRWKELLRSMAMTASSFSDLRKQSVEEHIFSLAGWHLKQELERIAPERLEVPSGNQIRLDYSDPDAPVLPVKIQEMFGATDTPRIAGGRVPVLLHLLAPNRRPQQVTQDLASFWENAYPEVRKELRQRYAKHPWPEDPLSAIPTAKTKRALARDRN